MNHYYDNDDDDDEEEEEAFIDPNDLIMINNPDSWEPSQEQIEVYATQLGIDPANSPPEAMEIAYKYLKQKIPPDWKRAFTKENPQVLYIDMKTNEIHLTTDIEESAKEEYLELMNDYREKLKQEEEDAKKVKVVPRTKIPPIGAKKVQENQRQEREKKFIDKQIENDIQYRKNKMEQEDQETKNLKNKFEKEEEKAKKRDFFDYKVDNNVKQNLNEKNDNDYNFNYNKEHENSYENDNSKSSAGLNKNDIVIEDNNNNDDNDNDDNEESEEEPNAISKKFQRKNRKHSRHQEVFENENLINKKQTPMNQYVNNNKNNFLNLDDDPSSKINKNEEDEFEEDSDNILNKNNEKQDFKNHSKNNNNFFNYNDNDLNINIQIGNLNEKKK